LGIAYNRVKDFSGMFNISGYNKEAFVTDTAKWGGDQTEQIVEDGGLGVFSLAGAFDVSPNVSFGLSLDIWSGDYSIDNRTLRNDYTGNVSWLDISGGKDDINAWSLKPSVLYFSDKVKAGAYLRLPMTFNIKQHNYYELYSRNDGNFFGIDEVIDPSSGSDFLDNPNDNFSTADYKIKAPMQVGFGFAYGNTQSGLAAIDIMYENWKEAEFKDEYDPNYFRNKYRSVINWRIGFERKLFGDAVGRIGYLRQPYTFKGPRGNVAGDPIINVDHELDFLTLGLSYKLDQSFTVDLAYAHGFGSQKESGRLDKDTYNRFYGAINYSLPIDFQLGNLR
jgi:long-subunit fatty acid transport protein